MTRSVITTGRTVDEAVAKALAELKVEESSVSIEVLEQPSKGILGLIGAKLARVQVTVNKTKVEKTKEMVQQILEKMGLNNVEIDAVEEQGQIILNIRGKNIGILIGRRGQTLDALQYLINLAVNKNSKEHQRIIVNVEGYRERREETLQRLALRLAEKAKKRRANVVLEPMNPHERRIIHTALQGYPDIVTYSEGEEPYRKVIISYKR